ncbi:putative spermidine/putrescine transport system permease protein [Sporobacter termitidis DSM 10068]|uniref:Putative spermidine/putrescine transport system permease protein n=1 Tax=Sporobacter termitidis DSM 10068 TaxID=1123282 RepID=A0A1M5URQ1_9FIRM|nr:ABC transporter permease subunit [Sporobacter termitidis]SHH65596.1 putative spermidine/putrescine transport system permease protein [Sporobacter termitidis DSM 10068]
MSYSKLKICLMLLPLSILMAVFFIGLINGVMESFGVFPAAGLTKLTFSYYQEVFQDSGLTASLLLSLYISLTASVFAVAAGVLVSTAATVGGLARSKFFQIVKLPVIVPHTVCALLMLNLFSQSGLLARIAFQIGLIQNQEEFLSIMFDKNSFGIILAYLWKEIPFVILVVVTVMANINGSLGEAAQNLGASKWKVFINVTLPLCLPSIATSFIIIFAYSFGAYELPFLLGATQPKALPVQAYVEYIYPDLAHRPYAMVLNSIMIVFTVFISYFYYRLESRLKRTGGKNEPA